MIIMEYIYPSFGVITKPLVENPSNMVGGNCSFYPLNCVNNVGTIISTQCLFLGLLCLM